MLIAVIRFLLNTLFDLLTFVFLLRFVMQSLGAPFANPIGQMTIALSDFAVKPMRRIVKSWRKWDLATLLLALICQVLLQAALAGLVMVTPSPVHLLIPAILGLVSMLVTIFFVAIVAQAILSWVNPYTPIASVLEALSRPVLAPIRRVLPLANGIDLSPLVALIGLQLINLVIIPNLLTA